MPYVKIMSYPVYMHLLFLNAMLNTKQNIANAIPAMAATKYMETSAGLFGCTLSLAAPSYGAPSAEMSQACMDVQSLAKEYKLYSTEAHAGVEIVLRNALFEHIAWLAIWVSIR